jgi:DNA-binding transcriptional LysR family regulator
LSGNLKANSGDILRRAAVLGQGLVYAPIFVVDEEIRLGRLVPILTEFLPLEMSIDAIYPHRRHLSPKVRCLIDLLGERLRGAKWADLDTLRGVAAEPALA